MKISTKSELKALIKECLIEILSEGTGNSAPIVKQKVRQHSFENASRPSAPVVVPEGVPSSMKSLFQDTQKRMMEQVYQENTHVDKQAEALTAMSKTWEDMTFSAPIPSRVANPDAHKGNVAPPRQQYVQHDEEDDFDPYEAVRSSRNNRK